VPGDTDNDPLAAGLLLVLDTSAWMRGRHPDVAARWSAILRSGLLRVTPATRLEILFTARSGDGFDELADQLTALRPTRLTSAVLTAAEQGMRLLARRSHGAHRLPIIDYLVAASAQEVGAAVLHYDSDYDTLAEVMEFESMWLAAPGSIP
jgi:hypothetical protein